ncbi:MAG: NF038122 family metalloprotease [Puniceicoccales bacterium]
MKAVQSCTAALSLCALSAHASMQFNIDYGPDLQALASSDPTAYANYTNGMQEATNNWASLFSDPITVNLYLDVKSGQGSLAFASTVSTPIATANVKYWLGQDRTTDRDNIAFQNLPIQAGFVYTTNENQNSNVRQGVNTSTATINTTMLVSRANQKALGALAPHDPGNDASLRVSSSFDWDFDRSDGIEPGKYDFVGVMMHEIGHAMGFLSGVDKLDTNPPLDPNAASVTVLDLFRQSAASVALAASTPGVFVPVADFAFGYPIVNNIQSPVYLSYDGGQTAIHDLAGGAIHTGEQASHFTYTGSQDLATLMRASTHSGILNNFTEADIAAFDIIGFDPIVVPEPATYAGLFGASALAFALWRRRRR